MQLRNKSHRIKIFATPSMVIFSNIDIQSWAGSPQRWAEGPPLIFQTVQNKGVVKNIKVALDGILN